MKESELDAAETVVYNAIAQKMKEAGWANWISEIDKRKSELRDIVQYAIQAAEDDRRSRGDKS